MPTFGLAAELAGQATYTHIRLSGGVRRANEELFTVEILTYAHT